MIAWRPALVWTQKHRSPRRLSASNSPTPVTVPATPGTTEPAIRAGVT